MIWLWGQERSKVAQQQEQIIMCTLQDGFASFILFFLFEWAVFDELSKQGS